MGEQRVQTVWAMVSETGLIHGTARSKDAALSLIGAVTEKWALDQYGYTVREMALLPLDDPRLSLNPERPTENATGNSAPQP